MATSSPLTSLSSEDSFYTAADSSLANVTAASSPTQDLPCPYRSPRQLPRELKQHCQIFLEEQLYSSAISLLDSILASGRSRRTHVNKAVAVPPPSHLALLSTLTIHPQYTSRADQAELLGASSRALSYLRNLLEVVGPVNADFRSAFQFQQVSTRWGRRSTHNRPSISNTNSDVSDDDSQGNEDRLSSKLANQSSVWHCGQDFWSVVGWAFNCCTLYPKRWKYWRVWLEFMIEVLEADWAERERLDREASESVVKPGGEPLAMRKQCMMAMYMEQQSGRQGSFKGIIKAMFADGGSLSSSAFQEVFNREPRGPKKGSNKRKRETLDIENDKFGDYFDDDPISSGASEPPTPQKPRDGRKSTSFGTTHPGMAESISLRLRIFRLLSLVTYTIAKPSDVTQLYEDYASALKVLPLESFSLFVSQRNNPLVFAAHITITKELFDLLVPSSHKDPRKVDKASFDQGGLSMAILEQCYLPHPANTVALEDNVKLSLAVENAMQLLWQDGSAQWTEDFALAAEKGITAREAKAKRKRTGKAKSADAGDLLAQEMLENSSQRIRILLEAMEACESMETE